MSSNSDASIPIELYSLVLQFLKDTGLLQTAEIFKKEVNKPIRNVNQEYTLVEVFKSYNSLTSKDVEEKAESDSSSSSESSSSSDEDDDQSSEDEVQIKKDNPKNELGKVNESSSKNEKVKNGDKTEDSSSSSEDDDDSSSTGEENVLNLNKESDSSDSSNSDSSSEGSEIEEQNINSDSFNKSSVESSSSDSSSEDDEDDKMKIGSDNESSSSSSEESDEEQEKVETMHTSLNSLDNKNDSCSNSTSSSDSESEESDNESENENKPENAQNISNIIKSSLEGKENKDILSINNEPKCHNNGKITSSEIDKLETSNSLHEINEKKIISLTNGDGLKHKLDSNNYDNKRPSKKLNSSVSTTPTSYVTTSVHFKPMSVYKNQRENNKLNKNKSNGNGNVYNRRIDPEKVEFLDERLKDNSFLTKGGVVGSYGYKAHNDLSVTRGKDFRAQKTKKKRGSYHGGKIDFESHSIKFAVED